MIVATKQLIKESLQSYGENELADRIDGATDVELNEIGKLAAKHLSKGGLLAKHVTLGAIEFFEGVQREPKRKNRDMAAYTKNESADKLIKRSWGQKIIDLLRSLSRFPGW